MAERRPPWQMSTRQAVAIEREAMRMHMTVGDFVEHVVARLGDFRQTEQLRLKLVEQLDWLLAGNPEDRDAPYLLRFEALREHPFSVPDAWGPQIDPSIDAFIRVHAPAAFGDAA